MSSAVPLSSVGDPEIVLQVIQEGTMTQAPVSLHDSDPSLPESESECLNYHIVTNHVYQYWPFLIKGVLEVPLKTTTNDSTLAESTAELPQGTLAEDNPFEFHICDQVMFNSIVNFLRVLHDPYFCEHASLLLRSSLCLMMEVPTAAA